MCQNTLLSSFHSIICQDVKNKEKFQTFSSKSGHGRLQEVFAYKELQM